MTERKIEAMDLPWDFSSPVPDGDAVLDLSGSEVVPKREDEKGRDAEFDRAYQDFVEQLRAEGALDGEKPVDLSGRDDEEAEYRRFVEQSGMAYFVGDDAEGPREAADMSGPAGGGRTPDGAVGGFFGVDELLRIAAEDGADFSGDGERQDEDLDLHDELRRRNHEEHFGPDPADGAGDEEMWDAYRKTIGEDR